MLNDIPDSIEPVVAYKSWAVSDKLWPGNFLHSHGWSSLRWEPGIQIVAKHITEIDITNDSVEENAVHPFEECPWQHPNRPCGIYGLKQLSGDGFEFYFKQNRADRYFGIELVHGQVYLWGLIIEHELGYRAQYAYPKCLYYDGVKDDIINMIANNYKIPAVQPPPVDTTSDQTIRFTARVPNATSRNTGVQG